MEAGFLGRDLHRLGGLLRPHHQQACAAQAAQEGGSRMSGTEFDVIEEHIEAAKEKLTDLAEIHLPAIAQFLEKLTANPLVTAFSASIPGELGADTQAVLNGLLPILGALGARVNPPADPTPAPPAGSSASSENADTSQEAGASNG